MKAQEEKLTKMKLPKYNRLKAKDLPPYQLYKKWQKVTGYSLMDKFGKLSRDKMLKDITTCTRPGGDK